MAFMFETKNGVYSRAGEQCNFKNPLLTMATRVELRRAYELYAGLTKRYKTIFDVARIEQVSAGDNDDVDSVLHMAKRAEVTWLKAIIHNRKVICADSWALIGGDVSRTLAQVKSLFTIDGVTYVSLRMYPGVMLQVVAGCGPHVFAASNYALYSATTVVHVHPFNSLRMMLLHSRLHMESRAIRFIPIY